MNLNKAMIIGNLTRDPEVRTSANGVTVTSFSVATSYVWNDQAGQKQEKSEFHNIVAWRKLGEICGQYLKKGSKVYVEGRLQTRDWTGQDGIKRYRTEIILDNMIMLDRAGAAAPSQSFNQASSSREVPTIDAGMPVYNEPSEPKEEEIRVEDIPF